MLAIKPRRLYSGNEELGAVGIFASIGHAQPAGTIVLQLEVLIGEAVTIDTLSYVGKNTSQ